MPSYNVFMNSNEGLTILKNKISYREIFLAVIATIIAVIAVGLCVFLIVHHAEHDTLIKEKIEECQSSGCYSAAATISLFRDPQADPCENFYQYACGDWEKFEKQADLSPDDLERTIPHILEERNENKLTQLLESNKPALTSYEKKIKFHFKSCLNDYSKAVNGTNNFIRKVLSPSGGWQYLNGWDENNYQISTALKKVHVDFWKNALFKVKVGPDWIDSSKNVIEIDLGGLTLYWREYGYNSTYYQKVHAATKEFMKTVADLIMRDSGQVTDLNERQRRATEFANDVFEFEKLMGNVTRFTIPSEDPHAHENRVKVSELGVHADLFTWTDIIPSMFREAGVTANTKVILLEKDFIREVNDIIKSLPNRKRTLNNYFAWKLMLGYVTDLGWEYIHANRVFYVARTGLTEFLGVPKYCFHQIKRHFSDALGALFIRDHLVEQDRKEIHDMVKYLKRSLNERLADAEWMEKKSKDIAIDKNKAIVEKLGYPEWMANNDFLDERYERLNVTQNSDYLSNLLALNEFERRKTNDLLMMGEDKEEWRFDVYSSRGYYDVFWNEMMIPAGLLQWPIFAKNMPRYYNYGAAGSYLAKELTHAVDEIGGYFLKNGTYSDWWTKNTTSNYNKRRACLEDLVIQAGPYKDSKGIMRKIKIDGTYVARTVTSEVSGLRTGFKAYQDFVASEGVEKKAPGLGLTNEQTYFLAYAQTQCFVRRDSYSLIRAEMHQLPEDVKVNLALQHTPEFVKTFNCPVSSQMHAGKMCEVF